MRKNSEKISIKKKENSKIGDVGDQIQSDKNEEK